MNSDFHDYCAQNPGSQIALPPDEIKPPDYEILDWEIEETVELLLDNAIRIGEQHSQGMQAAGRGPTPYAHRACTSYHAIEIIRRLQLELKAAEDTIEALHLEQAGEDS